MNCQRSAPLVLAERALDLAPLIALAQRAALVGEILAPCERDLDLRVRTFEVHPGRHKREALLCGLPDEPLDLPAVHEELPWALGVVVLSRGRRVRRDVRVVEPDLPVAERGVGVLQLDPALAERLDL